MNSREREQRRQVKLAIVKRLESGPATVSELLASCPPGSTEQDVRSTMMRLVRIMFVHSRRSQDGPVYELWASVIDRLQAAHVERIASGRRARPNHDERDKRAA